MRKHIIALILMLLCVAGIEFKAFGFNNIFDEPLKKCTVLKMARTDRELHCLKCAVRTTKTEKVKLIKKGDQMVKGETLLETSAAYDRSGRSTDNRPLRATDH